MCFISDKNVITRLLEYYYYVIIIKVKNMSLTRSNPEGIYTSWSITNNMTFTMFYPIIHAKLITNYM